MNEEEIVQDKERGGRDQERWEGPAKGMSGARDVGGARSTQDCLSQCKKFSIISSRLAR